MMISKSCSVLLFLCLTGKVIPQPPGGPPGGGGGTTSGAACDACGGSATYSEAITTVSGLVKRTITSSGCPNHYSYCTGKEGLTGCPGTGLEGSASEATEQTTSVEIPANPVIAASTTDIECSLGASAIALNGVSIYGGAVDGNCNLVDVDDDTSEWESFDFCSGHSQNSGDYHYHFPPSCLITQATATNPTSDDHSPQVGWAFDGFPIYGLLGPGGVQMTFTSKGCTGTTCLDSCSGQQSEIPSLDGFKYRYYFTGEISDLVSLPTDPKPAAADYPFTLKCYVGCTWATLSAGTCTGSAGVSTSYSAAATTGYTTPFTSFSETRLCGTGEAALIPSYPPTPAPGDPTLPPTIAPSLVPTAIPTQQPTSPTTAPTIKPTRQPTLSPTADTWTVETTITFDCSIEFPGTTKADFEADSAAQTALIDTFADTLEASSNNVEIESTTTTTRRRLDTHNLAGHLSWYGKSSLAAGIAVTVRVSLVLERLGYGADEGKTAYKTLTSTLSSAVTGGTFGTTLSDKLSSSGAATSLSVDTTSLVVGDYSTTTSSESSNDNSTMMIIIIAVAVGVAALAGAAAFYIFAKCRSKTLPA
ncbi:YHYH protein-domain-containing protein [Ochromonadaceae sp. CCMP2298]|nr:YHYH protein-domain-containing protein [Ochromonadaceae sp. CCMP2298]|mmetsp:Transcript_1694/g.3953  ORF Transcript_1694/g.3953 Transcript_1694/m.3953 type:complete len:589 (+) Transcript_1694:171-1937(+)